MRFTIVKNIGTNQPPQLSYDFIPPGGTIGCSTDNNWVLPDEKQTIAHLQAIVSVSADGNCHITNRGTASEVLLNTMPMAPDRQIEVRDGDIIGIGDYQIQVVNIKQSVPPLAITRTLNPTQPSSNQPENIPNAVWEGLENIFTTPDERSAQSPLQNRQELNDNNPLIKPQQHQERNPIDPLEQMETKINLDTLQSRATDPVTMFTPDNNFQQGNILSDSTPSALLEQNYPYENGRDKQEIDPLKLFSNNDFSDKHTQDIKIKINDPLSQLMDKAEPITPQNNMTGYNSTDYESKETPNQDNSLYSVPPSSSSLPPLFATEETTRSTTDPINHQDGVSYLPSYHSNGDPRRLDIDPMTHTTSSPHAQTEGIKLEGKLLTALLDGMGLSHIQKPEFDEHVMYKLGKLLSQLSQGIMALNASRILLRHKVNADVPQIMADANNPFKLLPSGQAVLIQIISDYMPGFMPPEQATRDILIELQAHQLGMIAGLRTIKANILQPLEPSVLEQKARDESGLPRLSLSSTYKAALWDYFIQHYQKTVDELEQSDSLFDENFRQTYEEEINRYKDSKNKTEK
ncbi:type VI secretion system-associated FHA domain protein TagH [Xenorhabdus sp. Sc-CR9]|uniref:type VI secretion system-associated FHA domain protein TagH n=1 Tax=Xenorhabdus sp. Sc-CR9 TaxID=2584468 RepID=UPI001EFF8350|nr:type VI secretion system-associated FHA domain protein TagH [Xenorhabdus sp. Sc-CR9]